MRPFPPRTLCLPASRTCLIKGRGVHVCWQTTISNSTEYHNQIGCSKSLKSLWRSLLKRLPVYHLLAMTISATFKVMLPASSPQEGGGRQALPFLNSSSSAAEDIKRGQSNPAPMLLFSHFTTGSHARGDGASKHAAAKTAATAEQKSCPKHRASDMGNKKNGLMLAPKLEIKNTMCKSTSCKYAFKIEGSSGWMTILFFIGSEMTLPFRASTQVQDIRKLQQVSNSANKCSNISKQMHIRNV